MPASDTGVHPDCAATAPAHDKAGEVSGAVYDGVGHARRDTSESPNKLTSAPWKPERERERERERESD